MTICNIDILFWQRECRSFSNGASYITKERSVFNPVNLQDAEELVFGPPIWEESPPDTINDKVKEEKTDATPARNTAGTFSVILMFYKT